MSNYTLHELEPQDNGEQRWSIVNWGPVAYVTAEEDTAHQIVDALNEDNSYNGWPNYPTWCVNLWLTNDPGTYEEACHMARRGPRELRDWVMEFAPLEDASMFTDLLTYALQDVDWEQVAYSLTEE